MQAKIALPIILDEHGDSEIYPSYEEAIRAIEAIDVRNNEYRGYDAEGRKLNLSADNADRITISLAEEEPSYQQELRQVLMKYLRALKYSPDQLEGKSIEELLQLAPQRQYSQYQSVFSALAAWFKGLLG